MPGTCIMNECFTDAISWCFSASREEQVRGEEAGDEAEEGDGVESEVCYSITHKVQFNVNCQIIS